MERAREKIVWGRASERKKENGGRRDRSRSYRCAWRRPGSESGPLNQGKASGSRERMARLMSGVAATSAGEDDEARRARWYLRVHAPPPPLSYAISLPSSYSWTEADSFGTELQGARHSFHFASTCHEEVESRKALSLSLVSIDVADTLPVGVHRRCGYVEIEHELGLTDISRASSLLIGPPPLLPAPPVHCLEFAANRGLPVPNGAGRLCRSKWNLVGFVDKRQGGDW